MSEKIRSLLFVPALQRKLQKIDSMRADAFIIDLEDSVKPENKEAALAEVIRFLDGRSADETRIFVRLNKDRIEKEIEALSPVSDRIAGYMIPKAESAADFSCFKERPAQTIALIETARGMIRIGEIAACSQVGALAFGAEDYCADIGMTDREDLLLPVKTQIVQHGAAFGKPCYDTISRELRLTEKLQESVLRSRDMGFEGKLAIHPVQTEVIDGMFAPPDLERMKAIIEAYETSAEGVIVFDGIVYEQPHIERMKKELKL